MDCRNVLLKAEGDLNKASQLLQEQGVAVMEKKSERAASNGIIESYIHFGNRLGVMVEVNCETDFVAHTEEFKELAHNLALQIAATAPEFVRRDELPEGADLNLEEVCLMQQRFIKDESKTIQEMVGETVARVREKISVGRFVRFEVGK